MADETPDEPRCYVCAPFVDGPMVRDEVHPRLRAAGFVPTATWASTWSESEDFSRPLRDIRWDIARNDTDIRSSHVALVLAREGVGGEMFAEARMAPEWGLAVVWVGRQTLSAWRRGVVRADSLDEAFVILARMREVFADGIRGELLACLTSADLDARAR